MNRQQHTPIAAVQQQAAPTRPYVRRRNQQQEQYNSRQPQQQESEEDVVAVLLPLNILPPQPLMPNPWGSSSSSYASSTSSSSGSITSASSSSNSTNTTAISNNTTDTDYYSSTDTTASSSSTARSAMSTSNNNNNNNNPTWSAMNYVGGLGLGLGAWLVFLILPKGVRKAYCRSERRKYTRRYTLTEWRDAPSDFSHHPTLQLLGGNHNKTAAAVVPPHIDRAANLKDDHHSFHSSSDDDDEEDEFHVNRPVAGNLYGKKQPSQQQRPPPRRHHSNPIDETPSRDYSVQDSILLATEERRKAQKNTLEQEFASTTQYHRRPSSHILSNRSGDDEDHTSLSEAEEGSHGQYQQQQQRTMEPFAIAANDSAVMAHVTPAKQQHQQPQGAIHRHAPPPPRFQLFPTPPSPAHPQIRQPPEDRIWRESLRRLSHRGVRVTAHGCQCDPKRIWLKYAAEDGQTLQWQTEFPRQVPAHSSSGGAQSIVLVRGALHRVPLANVLYIDVGKTTLALQKTSAIVPPSACFSLLTQQGSLDLQTNSKLERDAIVSALCFLLDQVHTSGDWRKLYQDSSGSSVQSPSEIGSSAISSELLALPSSSEI